MLYHQLDTVIRSYGKMAFVSGPRQVGKTTFARAYLKNFGQGVYCNWDIPADQKRIAQVPFFFEGLDRSPRKPFLVVLDEVHKYRRWKNYLKGAYDAHAEDFRFLVTGSGRLDIFKRGGDSLLGRYFAIPLYPLSVGELAERSPSYADFKARLSDDASDTGYRKQYERLSRFSGFPEPYVRSDEVFYRMWRDERRRLLVREDIRDATALRDVSMVEVLANLLPARVGSPLSLNSLREDIAVSYESVREWVSLLAAFYYIFIIPPFTGSLARALKKEKKIYLYDWGEIDDAGIRFENVVAMHLYKAVSLWGAQGHAAALSYIRDKEKREVDFVIHEKGKPVCLIECKHADTTPSPHLDHFQKKLCVPAFQLVHADGIDRTMKRNGSILRILSADRFLSILP